MIDYYVSCVGAQALGSDRHPIHLTLGDLYEYS